MRTKQISRRLRRFLKADEAVSALEYAVLVGVVVVGVGGAILTFSDEVEEAIAGIGEVVDDSATGLKALNTATAGQSATPSPSPGT